jgi:hypothetical protein
MRYCQVKAVSATKQTDNKPKFTTTPKKVEVKKKTRTKQVVEKDNANNVNNVTE